MWGGCASLHACVFWGKGDESHAMFVSLIWLPKSHFAFFSPPLFSVCANVPLRRFALFKVISSVKYPICSEQGWRREGGRDGWTMWNLPQDAGHLFRLSYKLCATINHGNDGQPGKGLSVTAFQLLWIGKAVTFCRNGIILGPNYGLWGKNLCTSFLFKRGIINDKLYYSPVFLASGHGNGPDFAVYNA